MDKIKIAQWGSRHLMYLPLYVADRIGLFTDQNLDVTIYGAGNDNDVFSEVARGHTDFGIGDPTFVALGRPKYDTCVIAALVVNAPMWGITHHQEIKPFNSILDFVGLRVGTVPRPSTTYTMLAALKVKYPRLLKSMQIVEAEIGQLAYLLASNKVDLVLDSEPTVSAAISERLKLVCSLSDFYDEFLFTGVISSCEFVKSKPKIVQKVVLALHKALLICHKKPEIIIDISKELFPTTAPHILEQAIKRMVDIKGWPKNCLISPKAWNNALKLRIDVGELKDPPLFEEVVNQSFAHSSLG